MLEGKDMVGARALLIWKTPSYRNRLSSCQTAPKKKAEEAPFLIGKEQKMYRMILTDMEANL